MLYIRFKQRVRSHATDGNGVMELEFYCHLSLDVIINEVSCSALTISTCNNLAILIAVGAARVLFWYKVNDLFKC